MAIEAASFKSKLRSVDKLSVKKIPNCAAAPRASFSD